MFRRWLSMVAVILSVLTLSFENASAISLSDQVKEHIKARIPASSEKDVVCRAERLCGSEVLPRFYLLRAFSPAWSTNDGPGQQVHGLVRAIQGADQEGLHFRDYHLSLIEALLARAQHHTAGNRTLMPVEMTDLDLLCTDGFLLYASHLSTGRVNPETIEAEWFIKSREVDLVEVLHRGLEKRQIQQTLADLSPPHPGYARLKQALAAYEDMMKTGGWAEIPPGPKMEKGNRGSRVAALRSRLIASGDLEASTAGDRDLFDDVLHQAVLAMQKRHGLEVDGIVGPATLEALNVSARDRLRQILVNLERWRWLPHSFGRRYIHVNIANFELDVVEDGRTVMNTRAMVGKKYRRTPVFAGNMTYLELNPYWNVPTSIAKKDILPRLRKDPQYLDRQNIRVFESWAPGAREVDPCTVDWNQAADEGCSFKLRQDPGPKNALGMVKFMFPNKFNVYLHDTPHRELFNKTKRSFSSGCIRVENPLELAEYLLKENPEWTRESIMAAIEGRENQKVSLPEPMPVLILYFTAWVDEDGTLNFRDDIYARDKPLYQALTEGPPKP